MNLKTALVGSLLAGLTIFVWGSLTHTVIVPMPVVELKDQAATSAFVAAHAPVPGGYMDPRGILVINAMLPGSPDKSQNMGPALASELASNILQTALLAWILFKLSAQTALQRAGQAALLGLTAWLGLTFSLWNWYGLPPLMIAADLVDIVLGWALAGLVLHWVFRKFA